MSGWLWTDKADVEEQQARLEQIRAGTMQQQQVNEGRELDLRIRRKRAEEGGEDDKKMQLEGLITEDKIEAAQGQARRRPGQERVLDDEQRGVEMDSGMRGLARVWGAFSMGGKPQALKMLSGSESLAKGVEFSDMSVEDAADESGKVVKDAKGKPVKMFVMTPAEGSKDKDGSPLKPIRLPVADMQRNWQQFGARYQVIDGNLMRIGADGVPTRLFTAPHTSVSTETGQFYDQRQPPPASAGTGVNPKRAIAGEKHLDDRVKQLDSEIRFYLTGSNTFANMLPDTQAQYDRLMAIGGQKIRAGMDPEQARNEAIAQHTREDKLKKSAPTQRGSGLTYQGAKPWLPGYDEGGIVNFDDQGGIGTGEEEKKKKKWEWEYQDPGGLPHMIPDAPRAEIPRVVKFAKGGVVRGPGGKDNVAAVVDGQKPVALTSGEGVLNKAAVAIVGEDFVTRLNKAALNITRPTRR